ncbi:MAG: MBL fold metallo-hydrolase [Oscillospiraceae bacterium]|nr:MBL fold metallo-hydrolase [Oscillospiraceae bacterium]
MDLVTINDRISYIEATQDPLSADIGIIRDESGVWLFDVGNDADRISGLSGEYNVVLSHFHQDHAGSIDRIRVKELYLSKETYRHIGRGTVVESDVRIGGLHIFPIPSSHTKGSLGLEVDESYAFVGDALYSKVKDGFYVFNAQLLKDEIKVLSGIKAPYFLVSHFKGLIRGKDEVIEELKEIYAMRKKDYSDIKVRMEP